MRTSQTEIRPDPTIAMMDDLLKDIGSGLVRVPAFQRPFVWRPAQMLELFDSIESGFPIGSLLLWHTDEPVPSLDSIGGVAIPPPPPGRSVAYVLDGHQRLSTLFGVLRGNGRRAMTEEGRDWRWRICRDLRDETSGPDRYRHFRGEGDPPAHLLPLSAVTRTMDFLRFSRRVEITVKEPGQVEEMVDEAEAVAQRIKSYKLTIIRLQGADLDQAVNVYTRLNRTGTQMDPDQMISALTYRQELPSLASQIDDIVDSVDATGFGQVPRLAVFRALLAIGDEPDILSPRWDSVARHMQNRLHDALPATELAVGRAVGFLREDIKLPLARLLPYSHQLVLLAVFFRHRPEPTAGQRAELRRWFWVTSWASAFGGATSTMLRRAIAEMTAFAKGAGPLAVDAAVVQPMPEAFNLNSARTKAYVIWELNAFPHRLDPMGQPFDVVKELASGESQSYRPVVPGDKRPANRLIMPTRPDVRLIDAVKGLELSAGQYHLHEETVPPARKPSSGHDAFRAGSGLLAKAIANVSSSHDSGSSAERVLGSHGIPVKAWRRLCDGGGQGRKIFVDDRTEFLERKLREFAESMGVRVGDQIEGAADDDSE